MTVQRLLTFMSFCLATCSFGFAAEMPVTPDVQASLFKRIFDYDRTLKSSAEARVLVLHDGVRFQTAEEVVRAFRAIGIQSASVPMANLASMADQGNVVYLTPEAEVSAVAGLCAEKRMLTVSGLPALAEKGEVAIGIGGKDDAPEILVNLGRVKIEQHELSSELLSLARVIR